MNINIPLIGIIGIITITLGAAALYLLDLFGKKKFGILSQNRVYADTDSHPGEILYARTLPLSGKPDFIIQENGMMFPVEVKTGNTPASPYPNHVAQLMAYCLLISEHYGTKPIGGYLRYPNHEFKIAFTEEAEKDIRTLVSEMIDLKKSNEEQFCEHGTH